MSNAKDSDLQLCAEMSGYATEMGSLKMKLANGVTADAILKQVQRKRAKLEAIQAIKSQLATLVDEKNAMRAELLKLRKQLRAGVLGVYGDDSAQFQAVGGVRASERKKPVRKV